MRNIWTIARREYKLYFSSPAAYMVTFLIMLVLGLIFYTNLVYSLLNQFQQVPPPGIDVILNPMLTLLLFATPGITMRLIAEEARLGTIELMLTAPVRDWELIVGKWLGGFLFLLTVIAITWIFPIVLNLLTRPGIDQGPLISGYLGMILIAASLVAIGVAVSSFFSNQIAAFFATLGIFMLLWLISMPAQAAGGGAGGGLIRYLDFSEHYYSTLAQGIIQLSDVIYYLSITAVALFIGTMSVEVRRWR